MKLYLFQCGMILTRKHLLASGPITDEPFYVPVPFFLIIHPHGNLLFDTGQPLAAVSETASGNYIPVMTESDYVVNQLKKISLKAGSISHIVLSHRHRDHAGGMEAFSNAVGYIQETEQNYCGGENFTARYPLRWHLLNGDHDVFGDGKVKIVFTPGHTPGHQSLLLKLDKWGETLLAADSVYLNEILDRGIMPENFHNRQDTLATLGRIKKMRSNGVRIIAGHDPAAWNQLKLTPEYYE